MAALPTVTVTGTLYEPDGDTLYNGLIYFNLPVLLKHADGTAVKPGLRDPYLVVDGAVSVELLYVDAPGWGPTGWYWEVWIPEGSQRVKYTLAPSVDDPDGVTLGDLLSTTPVVVTGSDYALAGHTHTAAAVTDFAAASVYAIEARDRIVTPGELVLPRYLGGDSFQLVSSRMYATHFTALRTETILNVRTTCAQAASGQTHAWIGYLKWTGTNYTLDSISVDDPTRWTSAADYPTLLFQTDDAHFGAADLTRPGFQKVKGQSYIQIVQVVASVGPKLMGNLVNTSDAFVEPRQNGYMDLAAPPSSQLNAEWLTPSPFQFQGLMQR